MKKQIERKKLQLSSETLRQLTRREARLVVGGQGLATPSLGCTEGPNDPTCDATWACGYGGATQ